jgi:hypothetical protein
MPHLRLPLILLTITLLACSTFTTTPTADPSTFQTEVAAGVAATLAASLPTAAAATELPATVAPTNTPITTTEPPPISTPRPIPTAFTPVSEFYNTAVYALENENTFGDVTVRFWRNSAPDAFSFDSIVIIAASGEPPIQIENVAAFDPLSGTDITGDGFPEVIVNTFSGGAHCCSSVYAFSMTGNAAKPILKTVESNCGGRFIDYNGDGILEFESCDDTFAYVYCSYAASPLVRIIYEFDPAQGYVLASPRFANLYAESIAQNLQFAEQGLPGERGEWDNTNKCSVLPLILDYLYSGQTEAAWSEFNRLYTQPDAAQFRSEIETTVFNSVRYVAP